MLLRTIRAGLPLLLALAVQVGAFAADDVTITLEQFGALRTFRPGDVTGICVSLVSSRDEPVECVVQWDVANADGDVVAHARPVTLSPGQPARRWLYARLRPTSSAVSLAQDPQVIRVFEARDGVRTRELTTARFKPAEATRPSEPLPMTQGLLAILGDNRMGLETLDARFDGEQVPSMHEATRVQPGVRMGDLPDRWEGLSTAETIVWCTASPATMDADRGQALRTWIEHGGHLVIVLPESGDPWSLRGAGSHALSAILPTKGLRRVEGLEIEALLPALTKDTQLRQSGVTTLATLFEAAGMDRGWKPLILLPAAAMARELADTAIAVQRILGHGRITLIGLDLPAIHGRALAADGIPQADVFWNRVLGRRADAPTLVNYNNWQSTKPSQLAGRSDIRNFDAGDGTLILDRIGQTGRASGGILAVLVFFVGYWVVAVPGAWLFLRRRERLAASWPAFALIAALSAPLAWGLSLLFSGSDVQVRHLSVADWIVPTADDGEGSRERRLRVHAWMGVALGGFGTTPVTLGASDARDELLMDWSPPPDGNANRFPDSAQAVRMIERPMELLAPSRATSTDMEAWSLARAPTDWGRVAWVEDGRNVETIGSGGSAPTVSIRGTIRHGLPSPLRDVTLIHVTPWIYTPRGWSGGKNPEITPSGLPPRPARMVALAEWNGEPLDLERTLYPSGPLALASAGPGAMISEMDTLYTKPLEGEAAAALGVAFGNATFFRKLGMLGAFEMLQPPVYRQNPPTDPVVVRFHRMLGREIDLSAWFTRPCVIVTGFLDRAPLPTPLQVDGREATSEGTVLVRFILPLPCEERGAVLP
jgi:hypothetical protein